MISPIRATLTPSDQSSPVVKCNTQPPYGNNRMFEDLLRSQKLQRSQNSRARQIIVSQIETQNPPESRSTIELKVIVDGPHTTNKVGDNSILQSNQEGPTPLPGIHGVNYPKPTGTELQKYHFK